MPEQVQSFKRHRRYRPLVHFFITPVLILNVFVEAARLYKYQTIYHVWMVIVAIALATFAFMARIMALAAQDRVIRLEERLRLASLMPEPLRARIEELTPSQLVGLRFASDEEAPALAERCLNGELRKADDVKREIRNWRADNLRV
ncbi:MAG TPA: DUF6526 family protein [Gemmatimonadaceae bacterium]|nr:DUF6526 family protein [Gemmatimonadaceae bacterium]